MIIRLPICDKDIPCAALKYAYPLSIILSDDNLRPWVAMNYLILCGTKKTGEEDVSNYKEYRNSKAVRPEYLVLHMCTHSGGTHAAVPLCRRVLCNISRL